MKAEEKSSAFLFLHFSVCGYVKVWCFNKSVAVLHKYVHKSVMISSPERTIWHRHGCKPL
jgi:hypothetical protein